MASMYEPKGGGHCYSTTEQVVATWIDGKPVYEKTYVLENALSLSPNTWVQTTISNSGIKMILKVIGIDSNGTLFDWIGAARNSENYIRLQQVRNSDSISVNILVLQYTKTTD